jgi:hypothetical protein
MKASIRVVIRWYSHFEWAKKRGAGQITTAAFVRLAKQERKQATVNGDGLPRDGCTVADLHDLVKAGRTFGTIYADPPWRYENQGASVSTDHHYRTMTLEELFDLPVAELAAEQSHLHLWTTNSFLRDAFRVIDAWGFHPPCPHRPPFSDMPVERPEGALGAAPPAIGGAPEARPCLRGYDDEGA